MGRCPWGCFGGPRDTPQGVRRRAWRVCRRGPPGFPAEVRGREAEKKTRPFCASLTQDMLETCPQAQQADLKMS